MGGSANASERLRNVLGAVASMSSDLSLNGLLHRLLREAGQLVEAQHGYFDVLDPRIGPSVAHGIEGIDPNRPDRQLLVDLLAGSDARLDAAGHTERVTFIGVPVTFHDHVFGHIYLVGRADGGGFSREDEEITAALASAAAAAIERASRYEGAERQRRWLEAAAEISAALLSPISRSTGLQLVADRTREVSTADFVGLLMPIDEDTLVVEAVSGVPADGVLGERIDARRSVAGDAARLRQTIVVPDTDLEPRYVPQKTPTWPDLGSLMVLPLRSGGEIGALIVGWFTGHEPDHWKLDPDVAQRFADQAALVLQVARAQQDQERLAVFVDRDRIGRDLHDLVIQRLFGIGLMLDNTSKLVTSGAAADQLSAAIGDIDQTIKDIRRTIFALSPAEASDLRSEIEQIVENSGTLLGFRPDVRLTGPVDSAVPDAVRAHLVAVLGEAMSNIVRHAHAKRVRVELVVLDDICLVVGDDGQGMDAREGGGTGLHNIEERAVLLGGQCTVESRSGHGTTVTWTVPRSTA